MERLKRSFRNSFRRKKSTHQNESAKPHQWEGDEIAVRNGNCVFPVKYLGCVQVQDSRGMHICEQALITLKSQKGKSIKGQLYVSGDGLRVVDDETKGLIVDQTIEKVSFCAPDRNHDRGFSYICRDGTTRRWMCHGFIATKDTGDRLSHAVGCSFGVCLERKQKRDAKLLEMKSTNATNNISLNSVGSSVNCNSSLNSTDLDNTTGKFSRTGSFRRIPLKQRMKDPQEAKLIEPLPVKEVHNPFAIERPHATPQLLERQGSCRIFRGLNQNSPFKRQLSLRYATPREQERNRRNSLQQPDDSPFNKFGSPFNRFGTSPADQSSIRNESQSFVANFNGQPEKENTSDLSAMCKYMTENLTMLSNKPDLFGESSFQQFNSFTSSKSPAIAKTNQSSSSTTANTPTPDSFVNSSVQHKTLISVDPPFKSLHSSSKSSTPKPALNEEPKEKPKFGQLSSYADDFFFNDSLVKSNGNSSQPATNGQSANGIMFTDLDGPLFEVNFDRENTTNVTKISVDSAEPSSLSVNNSSMNSLSNSLANSLGNSLTSSLNGDRTANDFLVSQMNSVNNNLSKNANQNVSNLSSVGNPVNVSNPNNVSGHVGHHPIGPSTNSLNRKNNLNNNILNGKLNEKKEIYDPFSADWVSNLPTKNDHRSTNPFLQNLGTTVFELKM